MGAHVEYLLFISGEVFHICGYFVDDINMYFYLLTALGSKLLGHQQEVYDITLYCLLIMPKYLASDKRFELLILVS